MLLFYKIRLKYHLTILNRICIFKALKFKIYNEKNSFYNTDND